MQFWVCPECRETIFGSLDVVLLLSSAHYCRTRELPRQHETRCLDCWRSPTGLCAYHARQAALRAAQSPDEPSRIPITPYG